jgi:hypothetical protein
MPQRSSPARPNTRTGTRTPRAPRSETPGPACVATRRRFEERDAACERSIADPERAVPRRVPVTKDDFAGTHLPQVEQPSRPFRPAPGCRPPISPKDSRAWRMSIKLFARASSSSFGAGASRRTPARPRSWRRGPGPPASSSAPDDQTLPLGVARLGLLCRPVAGYSFARCTSVVGVTTAPAVDAARGHFSVSETLDDGRQVKGARSTSGTPVRNGR